MPEKPEQPRWLSPDQLHAWTRIVAVLELLPAALDAQLRRDENLTHFDYYVLAMLSEAPDHIIRMTDLASHTNATLPRLSHVIKRLEGSGLVERVACAEDRRATNAHLTPVGMDALAAAAPGHVGFVRDAVVDRLSPGQLDAFAEIADLLLAGLDPEGRWGYSAG